MFHIVPRSIVPRVGPAERNRGLGPVPRLNKLNTFHFRSSSLLPSRLYSISIRHKNTIRRWKLRSDIYK